MPYGSIDGQINASNANSGGTINTTSTGFVSTGIGLSIGASYTGRFLVTLNIVASNATLNDGVAIALFRSAGGAVPAANAATTGSQIGNAVSGTSATANAVVTLSATFLDTAGIGTFTYYIAYAAVTGGTATTTTASNNAIVVVEI